MFLFIAYLTDYYCDGVGISDQKQVSGHHFYRLSLFLWSFVKC